MNNQVLEKLRALQQRDADMRARLLHQGKLYGDYPMELQQVHRENAIALHEMVAVHGWPGIALVGLDGCRVAWLLAQHSICTPDLQRRFLELLLIASESGDVPKRQVALLTDRVRFNEGKPQIYGTVFDWNEDGELACDIEDPANVDRRRSAVGLPPFSEALEKHREAVQAEGGKPPQDFIAYQHQAREWASRVGWSTTVECMDEDRQPVCFSKPQIRLARKVITGTAQDDSSVASHAENTP